MGTICVINLEVNLFLVKMEVSSRILPSFQLEVCVLNAIDIVHRRRVAHLRRTRGYSGVFGCAA